MITSQKLLNYAWCSWSRTLYLIKIKIIIIVTSTSTFALTCPYIYKMNIKESKVYSLAVWISRAYFIIYDIQNNNFEFYSAYANPTIILYGFLFEAVTGR